MGNNRADDERAEDVSQLRCKMKWLTKWENIWRVKGTTKIRNLFERLFIFAKLIKAKTVTFLDQAPYPTTFPAVTKEKLRGPLCFQKACNPGL